MTTAGYLAQHAGRARGTRDVALLDVCQDYVLDFLHQRGSLTVLGCACGRSILTRLRARREPQPTTQPAFPPT